MSKNKVRLVTGILGISIIALMFVVGAGLVKKIVVGPDKALIKKDNCVCKDCKCNECTCDSCKCPK